MGKRIEELLGQLGLDTPLGEQADDVRQTDWFQFIGEIDDLVGSDDYSWALSTLLGIRETVERTRRVSEAQRRAVRNIAAARREPSGWSRGGSRRYEGWR